MGCNYQILTRSTQQEWDSSPSVSAAMTVVAMSCTARIANTWPSEAADPQSEPRKIMKHARTHACTYPYNVWPCG